MKKILLMACALFSLGASAQHAEWSAADMPDQETALTTYQDYWGIGYMVPGLTLIDNEFFKAEIEKPFIVGTNENTSTIPYKQFIYMGSKAGRDGVDATLFVEGLDNSGMLRDESYTNGDVSYAYNDAIATLTVPAAPEGSPDGYGFGMVTLEYNRGANMNGFYVVDATGERTILINRTRCQSSVKQVHRAIFGVEPGHTYYVLSSDRLSAHLHKITFDACSSDQYNDFVCTAENSDVFWSADNMPDQETALTTYQDYWGIGYMVPGLTLIDNEFFKAEIEKPFIVGTNENTSTIPHKQFIYMGSQAGRDGVDATLFVEGLDNSGMLRNESYTNGDVSYAYNDAIVTLTVPAAPDGSPDGYGFGRVTIEYNRGANMNGFYVVDATGERTILINRTRCPSSAKKAHTVQFGVEPGHTYYVLSSDRLSVHLHSIGFAANSSDKYYISSTTGIQNITASKALNGNTQMYNLAGQKVANDFKGIVIMNGRKVVNK